MRLPDHLVGEVINDTLLVAVHKLRRGAILYAPRAYLLKVAKNAAIDRLRALYAVEIPSGIASRSRVRDTMLASAEIGADLRRAIQRLPAQQRRVIELRYLRDFSIADTAAILNIAPGTVSSTTAAALQQLRKIITAERGTWEGGIR